MNASIKIPFRAAAIIVCTVYGHMGHAQTDFWESARGQFRDPVLALTMANGVIYAGTGTESGGGGALYRSTNSGAAWTRIPAPNSSSSVRTILCDGSGRLIVGCAGNGSGIGIFYSDDLGRTWKAAGVVHNTFSIVAARYGLLAGTSTGVFRSTDSGAHWTALSFTEPVYSLAVDATGNVVAGSAGFTVYESVVGSVTPTPMVAAHRGMLYRSSDDGMHWKEVEGDGGKATQILVTGNGGWYVAGGLQGLLVSRDSGNTWKRMLMTGQNTSVSALSLAMDDAGNVIVGTSAGTLFRVTPTDTCASRLSSPLDGQGSVLALAVHGTDVFIGSNNTESFLLRSSDQGFTWVSAIGSLPIPWTTALLATSTGALIAGTDGIYVSFDNGDSWVAGKGFPPSIEVWSLAEGKHGKIWASAADSGVYCSADSGLSWNRASTPPGYYSSLAVAGDGNLFAIGDGALLQSADDGQSWQSIPLGEVIALAGLPNGVVLAEVGNEGLKRSTDTGRTWAPVTGIDLSTHMRACVQDSFGRIYLSTLQAVFGSPDSGRTWIKLTTRFAQSLAVNGAGYLFVGDYPTSQAQGPSMTKTHGLSWRDVSTGLGSHTGIICLTINAQGVLFAGTDGGGVFRSAVSTLPAVLADFHASHAAVSVVNVDWSTTLENELLGFVIDRASGPGSDYQPLSLSFVVAVGNTGGRSVYHFVDSTATQGIPYRYRLRFVGVENDLSFSKPVEATSLTGIAAHVQTPVEFSLRQNFPNPFNPSTTISYSLGRAARVTLEVYNVLGQRVAVLADGVETAGTHAVRFDATGMSSGMYLYRLATGSFVETRRMLLVK